MNQLIANKTNSQTNNKIKQSLAKKLRVHCKLSLTNTHCQHKFTRCKQKIQHAANKMQEVWARRHMRRTGTNWFVFCEMYLKFILYCGCRGKWRVFIAVNFPIYAIGREKLEKYQGFNGIRTRDLRKTGAMLDQLSCEATHWKIWTQQIDFASNVWLHSSVGRASHRFRGGHNLPISLPSTILY